MELRIASYCKIKNNTVWINDDVFFNAANSVALPIFLSDLYKHINLAYPKIFKMDSLCKLGVLTAELAIKNNSEFEKCQKDQVAILLSNNASSLETDRNHIKTIQDKNNYFPSPAVFVYTLPNIVIGEIAIKHKLTGENVFFVSDTFDVNLMLNYTQAAMQYTHTSSAICGWINVDGDAYNAFVFCIEKTKFNEETKGYNAPLTIEAINHIIKKD